MYYMSKPGCWADRAICGDGESTCATSVRPTRSGLSGAGAVVRSWYERAQLVSEVV